MTSYFQKQQIPRSNRFQKTTDSKKTTDFKIKKLNEQQLSTTSYLQKHHISKSIRFQKTTNI